MSPTQRQHLLDFLEPRTPDKQRAQQYFRQGMTRRNFCASAAAPSWTSTGSRNCCRCSKANRSSSFITG